MIRASDISDAVAAIDDALKLIDEHFAPGEERINLRLKLIRSRVDLQMALKKVWLDVENDIHSKREAA